jgi:hypothetical protein
MAFELRHQTNAVITSMLSTSTVSISDQGTSVFTMRSHEIVGVGLRRTQTSPMDGLEVRQESIAHRVASIGGLAGAVAADKHEPSAEDDFDVVRIRAAITQLPAVYQEALVLQVRCGCSISDIASELNLSLSQALMRVFLARQQLRILCGEDIQLDPKA